MNFADLRLNADSRNLLAKMRSGQIRAFRRPTRHNDVPPPPLGFYCTTNQDRVIRLRGIDPRRVDNSILSTRNPINASVTFGHLMFDHTNGGPGGPNWQNRPQGLVLPNETGPYQAAIVYGDAMITPEKLAARMYWSKKPGQSADSFRAELMQLLTSN